MLTDYSWNPENRSVSNSDLSSEFLVAGLEIRIPKRFGDPRFDPGFQSPGIAPEYPDFDQSPGDQESSPYNLPGASPARVDASLEFRAVDSENRGGEMQAVFNWVNHGNGLS